MTRAQFALLLFASLLVIPAAQAEVYKRVDEAGNVYFSDEPGPDAEKVQLPPIPTYTPPQYSPRPATSRSEDARAGVTYTEFVVVSPAPETTIRSNTGNVAMQVRLEPSLRSALGHRIQFMVDGINQGEPGVGTSASFQNLDRGSHTLSAVVLDGKGRTLRSADAVTIFVRRQTALFP